MPNRNNVNVPEARKAINQMKLEVANELGISNYDKVDKGSLSARENGRIGGTMVKRMIEMAEKQMSNNS